MSEKVNLEKNSNADIKEINRKLDLLINEVSQLKNDMNRLQSQSDSNLYKFDSQFRILCSDLKEHIYKLKTTVYDCSSKLSDGNYNLTKELKELQNQTTYSKFIDKLLPLSPVILAGGTFWLIFMYKLLH